MRLLLVIIGFLATILFLFYFIIIRPEKSCEEYDDFFGIKMGCNISQLKDRPEMFHLLYESKESGYKEYLIRNLDIFYTGYLQSFKKPHEKQIRRVALYKYLPSENSVSKNKETAIAVLDRLEKEWGEITNKSLIIEALDIDPASINRKDFDKIRGIIESPNSKHLEKIYVDLDFDHSFLSKNIYNIYIIAYGKNL